MALPGKDFFSVFLVIVAFVQKTYKMPPALARRRPRRTAGPPPIVNYCAGLHQLVLSCGHHAFPVRPSARPLTELAQKSRPTKAAFLCLGFRPAVGSSAAETPCHTPHLPPSPLAPLCCAGNAIGNRPVSRLGGKKTVFFPWLAVFLRLAFGSAAYNSKLKPRKPTASAYLTTALALRQIRSGSRRERTGISRA